MNTYELMSTDNKILLLALENANVILRMSDKETHRHDFEITEEDFEWFMRTYLALKTFIGRLNE